MSTIHPPERGRYGKILWTDAHDAAIKHLYRPDRKHGEVAALAASWGVESGALVNRAREIGVTVEKYMFRLTEEQKARIREVYEKRQPAGNKILAYEFGIPARVISREAAKLGVPSLLSSTRGADRAWRDDIEVRIVRNHLTMPINKIRQALAKKGYFRTHDQVRSLIMRKRASGAWPNRVDGFDEVDLLTIEQITTGLSVAENVVKSWIQRKMLRSRHGLRQQTVIKRKDLRRFLFEYRAHWRQYASRADIDFLLDVLDASTKDVTDPDLKEMVS
mgnify:CR=1 FL=1